MGTVNERRIIDTLLEMEDGAAALTSSGAGSDIIDWGAATKVNFDVILYVSACDVVSTDEEYTITLELSSSATFASTIVDPVSFMIGTNGISANADTFGTTGRYVIRASNEYNGTTYQYARLYVTIAGTTPSITFKAWASKRAD